jgi:hypothetical protein
VFGCKKKIQAQCETGFWDFWREKETIFSFGSERENEKAERFCN